MPRPSSTHSGPWQRVLDYSRVRTDDTPTVRTTPKTLYACKLSCGHEVERRCHGAPPERTRCERCQAEAHP